MIYYILSDLGFTFITTGDKVLPYVEQGDMMLAGPFYTFDAALEALNEIDDEEGAQ